MSGEFKFNNRANFKNRLVYCFWYSVLFLTIVLAICHIFSASGKSFIWDRDGIDQHYPVLIYIHNYLTAFVKNILQGNFSLPMVDYKIGQGMDVITTLNYYGFGDPLMLVSIFCPVRHMETLYMILIFVRLYLAGMFFSLFCFTKGHRSNFIVLTGALLYVFSGYGLYASVRHPFFVDGMIFLPLILIGVEMIINSNKYGFFTAVIGCSMLTNFYFTYMNTVIMALYILFRLIPRVTLTVKGKITLILKMMGSYICGILMSCIVAIPVIIAFLGSSRGSNGGYKGSLLHYDKDFYLKFLGFFFSPEKMFGEWTSLSFTAIAFVALVLLFFYKGRKKAEQQRNRLLKAAFILLTVMMLVPFAGKIMNGFAYVSNRWDYIYAMLIAYIVVCMLPYLNDYIALLIYRFLSGSKISTIKNIPSISICILMTLMLIAQAGFIYNDLDYVSQFIDKGKANKHIANSAVIMVSGSGSKAGHTSLEQTEQNGHIGNQSLAMNYYGNNWYFSIAPKGMAKYYNGFELNQMDRSYSLKGLDSRTMLNALVSVKYYVSAKADDGLIPYGFNFASSSLRTDGTMAYLYKNKNYLPLGLSYDKYLTDEEYDKLSPLKKQEALMQSLVINKKDAGKANGSHTKSAALKFSSKSTPVRIKKLDGMEYKNNVLKVYKKNATMTLSFDGMKNCETYLHMKNIEVIENNKLYQNCTVKSENMQNTFVLLNKRHSAWYKNSYLTINLGYSYKPKTECTITIPAKGKYRLSDINILFQPIENYDKQVKKLSCNTLTDLKLDTNKISGKTTQKKDSLMFFSIPYSKGWKAYVDGKAQPVFKTNKMYMSINVKKGSHSIDLTYCTPGLKIGLLFSIIGFIIFLVILHFEKKGDTDNE